MAPVPCYQARTRPGVCVATRATHATDSTDPTTPCRARVQQEQHRREKDDQVLSRMGDFVRYLVTLQQFAFAS